MDGGVTSGIMQPTSKKQMHDMTNSMNVYSGQQYSREDEDDSKLITPQKSAGYDPEKL